MCDPFLSSYPKTWGRTNIVGEALNSQEMPTISLLRRSTLSFLEFHLFILAFQRNKEACHILAPVRVRSRYAIFLQIIYWLYYCVLVISFFCHEKWVFSVPRNSILVKKPKTVLFLRACPLNECSILYMLPMLLWLQSFMPSRSWTAASESRY